MVVSKRTPRHTSGCYRVYVKAENNELTTRVLTSSLEALRNSMQLPEAGRICLSIPAPHPVGSEQSTFCKFWGIHSSSILVGKAKFENWWWSIVGLYCHLNELQTEASFTVHRSQIQGESLSPLILFLKIYLFSMDIVEIYTWQRWQSDFSSLYSVRPKETLRPPILVPIPLSQRNHFPITFRRR